VDTGILDGTLPHGTCRGTAEALITGASSPAVVRLSLVRVHDLREIPVIPAVTVIGWLDRGWWRLRS